MLKTPTDFVLGFICDKSDKRIGMRVYNITTAQVSEVSIPEEGHYLNLYIREGHVKPRGCPITAFPVFVDETARAYRQLAQEANAWVLCKYADKLKLLSVTGQVKIVTNATALGFHKQYGIIGCLVSQDGSLLTSTIDYISLQVFNDRDKEGARAVLALRYDLGTNLEIVLFKACQAGDLELVQLLVASELLEHANSDNALGYASENGHLEVVKLLLASGADLHAEKDTALRFASKNGHVEVVEFLLENGADIHEFTDYALRMASNNGHIGAVELLLSNGAYIHAQEDFALKVASRYGHTGVVEILLSKGANVHSDNDRALRFASEAGHTGVVKLLLDNGADIHADNDYALRIARANGNKELVTLLSSRI